MFLLTVLCVLLLSVASYTRELRTLFIDIEQDDKPTRLLSFAVDIASKSLLNNLQDACEIINCERPGYDPSFAEQMISMFEEQLNSNLLNDLNNISVMNTTMENRWLGYTDVWTQRHYIHMKYDVNNLRSGEIMFHGKCNYFTNIESKDCLFTKLAVKHELAGFKFNDITNTIHHLHSLVEFAEDLFNHQLYDHTEAVTFHLLFHILPQIIHTDYHIIFDTHFDVHNYQFLVLTKLSLILSETFKVKGNLSQATTLSLFVIYLYQVQHYQSNMPYSTQYKQIHKSFTNGSLYLTNGDGFVDSVSTSAALGKVALHQLRLILTIPHIPSPTDISQAERSDMLQDLRSYIEMIRAYNITVPLEMLSSEISATPFHMAHQGLNDRDLQMLLSEAFTTLCPGLVFIAPKLPTSRVIDLSVVPRETPSAMVGNQQHNNGVSSGRKILKIAFISSHFFDHSIGRILVELMLYMKTIQIHNDGQVYDIELIVYFIDRTMTFTSDAATSFDSATAAESILEGPPTIGTVQQALRGRNDEITQILEKHFQSNFRRLPDNIHTIREIIGREKLDFLFFADVGMDFASYALAFSRLATYQAAWWGHPITTGIETIDYFISLDTEITTAGDSDSNSDSNSDSAGDKVAADMKHSAVSNASAGGSSVSGGGHYSEQLVRMEWINTVPLGQINKTAILSTINHHDINIPADSKIALVLGRLFKIHPDFVELLVETLLSVRDVDEAYVVFIAERTVEYNAVLFERIETSLEKRFGLSDLHSNNSDDNDKDNDETHIELKAVVSGLLAKLRFVNYNYYVELLAMATVVLDTYPYGGCLTAHDALGNSIPMVTLSSQFIRGRFTQSMYQQMEHTDLIAQNATHYVSLVHKLLTDDAFVREQSTIIGEAFRRKIHKNKNIAHEWLQFVLKLFT